MRTIIAKDEFLEYGMASPIIDDLAQMLAVARANEHAIAQVPEILTAEQAYEVQVATMALQSASIVAYKIGLTTPKAQAAKGWDAPIVGRLPGNNCVQSPASLTTGPHRRFAEAELLFEIGEDFEPGAAPFSEKDVAKRISGLFAGVELCASRYAFNVVSIFELIADNSNADMLIIGPRLASGWDDLFGSLPVTLHRNGHEPVIGSTSAVLGNPLTSVTWLANWLAAQGQSLKRGQIIASGSCTGITALDQHEQLIADFGGLGTASVTITPAKH